MADTLVPSKSSITITWNPNREVYEVRFVAPEDQFKQILKAFKKIDLEHRSYNSATRLWSFTAEVLNVVRDIAVRHFREAQLVEGSTTTNLHSGRTVEQLTLFPRT